MLLWPLLGDVHRMTAFGEFLLIRAFAVNDDLALKAVVPIRLWMDKLVLPGDRGSRQCNFSATFATRTLNGLTGGSFSDVPIISMQLRPHTFSIAPMMDWSES